LCDKESRLSRPEGRITALYSNGYESYIKLYLQIFTGLVCLYLLLATVRTPVNCHQLALLRVEFIILDQLPLMVTMLTQAKFLNRRFFKREDITH